MYQKIITFTLIATALSACSDKDNQAQNTLNCNDPAVVQNMRQNIQNTINQQARSFAQSDSRHFIDPDKVIAAGSELTISLNNITQSSNNNDPVCTGTLNVQIPATVLTNARNNSPFVYSDTPLAQIINNRLNGSNISYDNNGNFNVSLNYLPQTNNNQTTISYPDNSLSQLTQTLSAALLPYGVKSILLINGQAISRETALATLQNPEPENIPETQAEQNPQAILDSNSNAESDNDEAPTPETLSPHTQSNDEVMFSANELAQAKSDNNAANAEINSMWNSLDKEVQQQLLDEQRNWIQNKTNSCQQAASKGNTTLQAQYLQLQCDTRMTRERSQYLRGYSIN